MRITPTPPDAAEIARLEAAARSRPALYRARLAVVAVLGDAVLTFIRVFPLAAPIALGAMLHDSALLHGMAALAALLLVWTMRPMERDRGRVVTRGEAPARLATRDQLGKALASASPRANG